MGGAQMPRPPPNGPQFNTNLRYKTQLCKHFEGNQLCPLQTKCSFAHGRQELRSINDPLPHDAYVKQANYYMQPLPYNNYKTVKCKNFETTGVCKYDT